MSYFFISHSRLIINRESRFAKLSRDVYLFCLASYLPVCLNKRISENLSNLIRTRLFIITLTQTRKAQVEYTTSKPKNYVHGLFIVRSFSRRIAKSQAVKSNWRIAKIVKLIYYSPTKKHFFIDVYLTRWHNIFMNILSFIFWNASGRPMFLHEG